MDYLIGLAISFAVLFVGIPLLTFGVMAIQCHKAGKKNNEDKKGN